jgi:hypothetical protein
MSLEGFDAPPTKTRIEGFTDDNLKIDFEMDPPIGEERHITAYFTNQSGNDLTGLNMLVAVQKNMKIVLQPATSSVLNGDRSNTVQQEMKVSNPFEGTKPIVIKIKVSYTCNGNPVNAMKTVSFPLN